APTAPELGPPPKRPSRASSTAAAKAAKVGAPPAAPDDEKAEKNESTAPRGTPGGAAGTGDRSLDQMILDYLASEDVPDEVAVTLSPSPDFQAGRPVQTRLKAVTGSPPRPVSGAVVQVRILSTS